MVIYFPSYPSHDARGHVASTRPSPFSLSIILSLRHHSDFNVSQTACLLASCKFGLTMDIPTCIQMTMPCKTVMRNIQNSKLLQFTDFANHYSVLCAGCRCACKGPHVYRVFDMHDIQCNVWSALYIIHACSISWESQLI